MLSRQISTDWSHYYFLFLFFFQLLNVEHYQTLARVSTKFLRHIFWNHLIFPHEKYLYYLARIAGPQWWIVCWPPMEHMSLQNAGTYRCFLMTIFLPLFLCHLWLQNAKEFPFWLEPRWCFTHFLHILPYYPNKNMPKWVKVARQTQAIRNNGRNNLFNVPLLQVSAMLPLSQTSTNLAPPFKSSFTLCACSFQLTLSWQTLNSFSCKNISQIKSTFYHLCVHLFVLNLFFPSPMFSNSSI